MPKAGFYAVAKGRIPGVYSSWSECEEQVKGYTGAKYKKFNNRRDADSFIGLSSKPLTCPSTLISTLSTLTPKPTTMKSEGPELEEKGWDVVYSDGACKGNGKPGSVAGIGVWWGKDDPRNIAERCPGQQTNNRAELIAIVRALETWPLYGPRNLLIKTDSRYSINCLTEWFQKWEKQNWVNSKGEPVINRDLIKYVLSLLRHRGLLGQRVKFKYVKGHAGIEGNEGADYQANRGAELPAKNDRDWKNECAETERLIKELEEGVETFDKAIQVDLVPEDDLQISEADLLDLEGMEAELAQS